MSCCIPSIRLRKKKISALPAGQAVSEDDFFEIVQEIDGKLTNVQVTVQDAMDYLVSVFTTTVSPNLDGVVDPEGVVEAAKNIWYRNSANDTYWWKVTDGGSSGWHQVI